MKAGLIALLVGVAEFFYGLAQSLRGSASEAYEVVRPLPEVPEVKVGTVAINPRHTWIEVMNPEGRRNGNGFRDFGESASISEGGKLTVVAAKDEHVLVSYESPNGQGYGAEAGNGTLLFIPKRVFASMAVDSETPRASEGGMGYGQSVVGSGQERFS